MINFRLDRETLENIETATGFDSKVISDTDVFTIDKNIEKLSGKRLQPALSIGGLLPRGSVYLMFNRLFTSHDINKGIDRIKP